MHAYNIFIRTENVEVGTSTAYVINKGTMKLMMNVIHITFVVITTNIRMGSLDVDKGVTCKSPQSLEIGKIGIINCTSQAEYFGVLWYDTSDYLRAQPILHYRNSMKTGPGYDSGQYDIFPDGSLIIKEVTLEHERTFKVAYLHSKEKEPIPIDVEIVVIVYPVPAFPVVAGCDNQQNCLLDVKREGSLICTLTGIRPLVHLEWKTFYNGDNDFINFRNQQLTVKDNEGTYDVTVTASYYSSDNSPARITLACGVVGSINNFTLKTNVELKFVKARSITCRSQVNASSTYEVISMSQPVHGLKEQFLKEIRGTYKDQYDAVQPIPYVKDRLFCVDKVFVEGSIEFLESIEGEHRRGIWQSLNSYEDVFNDERVRSIRRILEGEPGYGKSTVTLQFAFDWCNSKSTSPFQDVDILILLRLRQLGGIPSIYKAIKQFLLPIDTTISVKDIDDILRNSKRVVFILDGFDEYPDQDSTTITGVITIIARQMFQDFEVVTTTRSSCLPKKYPPLTTRVRLTGFDDNARKYYIHKAVVRGNDDDGVNKIERYLQQNPIVNDLCQVPLLFVIFAHMMYEEEQFRKLNSATSLFRYMISGFHSHLRNKMKDANVSKYELFETDHGDLDKVAFKALSGKSQKIVWKKDELCHLLGQGFYDQYIRIGILVEEEVIDIVNDPSTPITEHVQYRTEVRFYHKLFCEWYASHYLSHYMQHNPYLDLNEYLKNLDPFDVQYLYRFSCGLNSKSAEHIIRYLKNIEGGDQFAILCILEQTGKIDTIKDSIRDLCFKGVIISRHESLLQQRSSLQLLHVAAKNDIPIEYVNLHNSFDSVDFSKPAITTTTGLSLTSEIPFKKLRVSLYKRKITKYDVIDILKFASLCSSLRILVIYGSAPPGVVGIEPTLKTLNSKEVKVQYHRVFGNSPHYILNLETGRWERESDGKECTDEDFEGMNATWATLRDFPDEKHKEAIKKHRDNISKEAEQRRDKSNQHNNEDKDDDAHDKETLVKG